MRGRGRKTQEKGQKKKKKLKKLGESETIWPQRSREQYFIDKWEDDATEEDGKSFYWIERLEVPVTLPEALK